MPIGPGSGGGGSVVPPVTAITTGAAPVTAPAVANSFYSITTGGTAGVEVLNLPNFALDGNGYNNDNIGQRVSFSLDVQTDPSDVVQITLAGSGTIPMTPSNFFQNARAQRVTGGIILEFAGASASVVWRGDRWLFDHAATGSNDDSVLAATNIDLRAVAATGASVGPDALLGASNSVDGNAGNLRLTRGIASGMGDDGQVYIDLPAGDPGISGALYYDIITNIVTRSP